MYKRGTFGASYPPLRSRYGIIEAKNLGVYLGKWHNEIVMKETRKVRNKWLTIRLNKD